MLALQLPVVPIITVDSTVRSFDGELFNNQKITKEELEQTTFKQQSINELII